MPRRVARGNTDRTVQKTKGLFVGRVDLLNAAVGFLSSLSATGGTSGKALLNLYGVGGVGKTALLEQIWHKAKGNFPKLRLPTLDLDFDWINRDLPAGTLFWAVREALHRERIPTPLFDCLYFYYWTLEHPGETFSLRTSPFTEPLSHLKEESELLAAMKSFIGEALETGVSVFKVMLAVDKVATSIRNRYRRKGIAALTNEAMDQWSRAAVVNRMPEMIAYDLSEFLVDHPDSSICLGVDGFDRIQSPRLRNDAQKLFQQFCANALFSSESPTRSRFGLLICGRDMLRWHDLYDDDSCEVTWLDLGTYQTVEGLTLEDAANLFQLTQKEFEDAKRADLVTILHRQEEHILEAAREETLKDHEPTYLPFYLHLAIQGIQRSGTRNTGSWQRSASMEIEQRFLRQIDASELRALQVLALPVDFDESLFQFLVDSKLLTYFGRHEFTRVVGSQSCFLSMHGSSARFHRHMREALIRSQISNPEERKTARAALEHLLGFYARSVSYKDPIEWSESHSLGYQKSLSTLLATAEDGIADVPMVLKWWRDIEGPVDNSLIPFIRLSISDRCRKFLTLSDCDLLEVVRAYLHTAMLCDGCGDYQRSRRLVEEASTIYSQLGPPNDLLEFQLGNFLITSRLQQGSFAEATRMAEELVSLSNRLDGPRYLQQAQATLARCYMEASRARAALPVCQAMWQSAQDEPGSAFYLLARLYLGDCYYSAGYYEKALPIYRDIYASDTKQYGTVSAMAAHGLNRLGSVLQELGMIDESLDCYRKASSLYIELLGPTHPNVALNMFSLAIAEETSRSYQTALKYIEQCQEIAAQRFPPGNRWHSKILMLKARLLGRVGDQKGAEAILDVILERSSGESNIPAFDVAIAARDLAELHSDSGAHGHAAILLGSALSAAEECLGGGHPIASGIAARCVNEMIETNDLSGAEALAKRAWTVARERNGAHDLKTMELLLAYASVLHLRERWLSSMMLLAQFLDDSRITELLRKERQELREDKSNCWIVQNACLAFSLLADAAFHEGRRSLAEEASVNAGYCLTSLGLEGSVLADVVFLLIAKCKFKEFGLDEVTEMIRAGIARAPNNRWRLLAQAQLLLLLYAADQFTEMELEAHRALESCGDDADLIKQEGELFWLLGVSLNRMGRFSESEEAFRSSLRLRERVFTKNDLAIAVVLRGLSKSLRGQQRLQDAKSVLRRESAVYEEICGIDYLYLPRCAVTFADLASLCLELGEVEESERYCMYSLSLLQATKEREGVDAIAPLTCLAQIRLSQSEFLEAERLAKQALDIAERDYVPSSSKIPVILALLLNIQQTGKLPDAGQTESRLSEVGARPRDC